MQQKTWNGCFYMLSVYGSFLYISCLSLHGLHEESTQSSNYGTIIDRLPSIEVYAAPVIFEAVYFFKSQFGIYILSVLVHSIYCLYPCRPAPMESTHGITYGLHLHVLHVLGMQMRSCLHMQISHVPLTAWL